MRHARIGRWRTGVVVLAVAMVLFAAGAASLWALATDGFQLSWWTADGGGGCSEGGGFVLSGTAGQPDAGLLTGPGYTLGGGFWAGGVLKPASHTVYLPVVLRGAG
jgi:hypothetical protein